MNIKSTYVIPATGWAVEDKPAMSAPKLFPDEKVEIKYSLLERYFNDIYKLFISKLSKFDASTVASEEENKKLKALLDELIYVKALLVEGK